jgi:glycerol uptake facilitator-like aquaporin
MVILLSRADGKNIVAFNVGIYICAAIIFTSSASFANPVVTIARMFTETFAGIHPSTIFFFIGSQIIGLGIAYTVYMQIFEKKS